MLYVQTRLERGERFEVEGVEVGVSGFNKEKILVTGTEGIIGGMKEVEGEEAREEDKDKLISVK